MQAGHAQKGFTLVEVLVALFAMALLAALAWQGLDGVLRSRDAGRELIDSSSRLSTVLTQWEQDLQAVHDTQVVPALSFDGQSLRMTRRVDGGVALVVWAVRGGQWQRWASPVMVRGGALQEAWLSSQQFQGQEPGQLTVASDASEWQIYYHLGNEWSNAQSTGNQIAPPATPGGAPAAAQVQLPQAVRLVMTLQGKKLTRDIALGLTGQ